MANKRKPVTATRLPTKKSLRVTADRLWSRVIRDDWCSKCAVCNSTPTEAHHLVPRTNYATRYLTENGIALCFRCHKADDNLSPHLNAAGWMSWLEKEHPNRAEWYCDHKWDKFGETKTQMYFVSRIESLRPYLEPVDFESIVGPKLLEHLSAHWF